jgi:hypothetical protein
VDEPPSVKVCRGTLAPTMDALRERPGHWALVATYKSQASAGTCAKNIRDGRAAGSKPAGSFDAVSRRIGDKRHAVYARFVAEEPKAEATA